ncbi:MAG: BlaI/MecI/CopY family transcriptional regulator [Calditrichaeota bacterium]|nr:MAG: BlaI/MecI/CopY family transcriptional regulator [Calditrichota bacterium]
MNMARRKSQLTPPEWEVMEIIWQKKKPVTVREVLESAYPGGEKAYTTVQTIMNNLVQKGFLSRTKIGMVNHYRPAREQMRTLMDEIKIFANRTFGGSLNALVSFLINSNTLSPEEISELKQLIEQKEQENQS